jgi:hypothetical protein
MPERSGRRHAQSHTAPAQRDGTARECRYRGAMTGRPSNPLARAAWPGALWHALLAITCALAATTSHGQPASAPSAASRDAFGACDAQAFLVLNIARNYMMTGRNRDTVMPHLKGDANAEALADDVFRRIDAGTVHHPGELAADTLFQCAAERKIDVGAPREHVALCFTRTDVAFFLHAERSQNVARQQAVSKVRARLTSRELYPVSLINQVAEAVYAPPQLPDLRQLMGRVAWTCINQRPVAASPASR